jgi:hypothetical protein
MIITHTDSIAIENTTKMQTFAIFPLQTFAFRSILIWGWKFNQIKQLSDKATIIIRKEEKT